MSDWPRAKGAARSHSVASMIDSDSKTINEIFAKRDIIKRK